MQLATPEIAQKLARHPERTQHIFEEMCQVGNPQVQNKRDYRIYQSIVSSMYLIECYRVENGELLNNSKQPQQL